jgi:hypothetical protein
MSTTDQEVEAAVDVTMQPLRVVFEFRLNGAAHPRQRLKVIGDQDALGVPVPPTRQYFFTSELGEPSWRDNLDQRVPAVILRRLALILYLRSTLSGTNRIEGLSPEARKAVAFAEAADSLLPCFEPQGDGFILVVDLWNISEDS